jgi:alkylation response protein AidB-like acyl-CoA dehydrogenase
MDWNLSEQEVEIRDWARRLTQELIAPHALKHARQKIDIALVKRLSQEGVMTLLVPEALGGMGLTSLQFALVVREISRVCGSVGVSVAVSNMIADVLCREGSAEIHQKFVKALCEGRSPTASFCLTENGSGSDASQMKTSYVRQGDHYVLTGEKIYVTNGAFSEIFLVMARDASVTAAKPKISAFVVERGANGFVLGGEEEKMGLEGSSTIRLSLDQVRVPASSLVGSEGEGFKIAMRALDGGRISVSAQALGLAEAALQVAIDYAKQREAFGQTISQFQGIQWKIADAATQLAAAESLVMRAAFLKDRGQNFTREASQAKVFTTEAAVKVCEDAIQILGGYGYIKEYPVERLFRDVRVTTLYEGTSEIQRMVIARSLLNEV